jgi:ribosomal protein S18 acetylase RimI-like enzyme
MKDRAISRFEEIRDLVNHAKKPGHVFLTNWYTDESKCNFWIDQGVLSMVKYEAASFILRKHLDFHYLYFLSSGIENLEAALKLLANETSHVYVVDLVEKGDGYGMLPATFERQQFRHHETLIRMFMKRDSNLSPDADAGKSMFSSPDDALMIYSFLTEKLDRYSEQIPSVEEIKMMIRNNQVLLIKEGSEIGGILYFEKNGMTSHLREWLVNEKFRNQHVGSRLMSKYFQLSSDCSRFILWVKKHNDHAVEIYKHYGYSTENINDRIFVNL